MVAGDATVDADVERRVAGDSDGIVGIASVEVHLQVHVDALFAVFGFVFAPRSQTKVAAAAAVRTNAGSCASVDAGMSGDVVRTKLGAPDQILDDGKTRGPGASTWVYRDARCAVHMLDGNVELVD